MNRVPRLWYCDNHEIHLPPVHKFPMAKYRLLREALTADPRFTFDQAPPADPETIQKIHDPDYVQSFLNGTLDPKVIRRIGFPWSQGLVNRTLASVGGTLEATKDALESGWGGTLAGGTHHAFQNEGSGFCVFNDIAVAIAANRETLRRVAVLDLDVHQGDGTAKIFENDPDVLTISIHGRDNFPFRKQTSTIDIALPDKITDETYLQILDETLGHVEHFQPEALFYQSGVDALNTDKLGRLELTHEGLVQRDRKVFHFIRSLQIPCIITLGGGYSDPITATVRAHANTFQQAADLLGNNHARDSK